MPYPKTEIEAAKPRLPRIPGLLSPYRLFIRPLLFRLDAETVHHLMISLARFLWSLPFGRKITRAVYARGIGPMPAKLAGLELPNPVGLAAGFDKNAILVPGIENLGFGFVEVGTVTPRPQLGNPKPRLMRIAERRALLNRMGFNNDGAEIIATQLRRVREAIDVPVGVNIGKSRDTPNSEAVKDYEALLNAFRATASYFVVNVSSPNTPGLRDLQNEAFLKGLAEKVLQLRVAQPVFVKLAPDLDQENLMTVCALCGDGKPFAGLVLTNTIPTDLGGISGYPLKGPATAVLKAARGLLPRCAPIISVGGIETAAEVLERFRLGADAVQLYSALIYQGPGLPGRILREVQATMRKRGIRSLSDLREI